MNRTLKESNLWKKLALHSGIVDALISCRERSGRLSAYGTRQLSYHSGQESIILERLRTMQEDRFNRREADI